MLVKKIIKAVIFIITFWFFSQIFSDWDNFKEGLFGCPQNNEVILD